MGYQALLFCPDEKTARALTHVLGELEFNLESCNETYAAVKRLMSVRFDAIVVDCDNEQNATLLFKSARNSAANQSSLSVAVVEGQAGVAKAFRIGANLVLTKPINVEQAKGTLRVARGLLRKGDPGKPSAPASAKPAQGVSAAPAPAIQDPDAASAASAKAVASPRPPAATPPVPSAPAVAAFSGNEDAVSTPAAASAALSHSGAASAPAPAREILEIPPLEVLPGIPDSEDDHILESPVGEKPPSTEPAREVPPPTFGAASLSEKSGPGKKIVLGIAVAALVAVGLYFGWTYYQEHRSQPVTNPHPETSSPAPAPRISGPRSAAQLAAAATQPSAAGEPASGDNLPAAAASSAKLKGSASSATDKSSPDEKPTAAPLVVKGGAALKTHGKTTPDTPAPSIIGIAAPDSTAPLPDLGGPADTSKPLLQRLNVSQGVSQGLLITKVNPVYPASALRMHVEGPVQLLATISKDGNISQIKVLSGDKMLSTAAVDAVKRWKYKPYLLNGEPVEIQTEITIVFKLPR